MAIQVRQHLIHLYVRVLQFLETNLRLAM
jgi:hypothetical protein